MDDPSELIASVGIWIGLCALIGSIASCNTTVEPQQKESKANVKEVNVEQPKLQAKRQVRFQKIIPTRQYT